MKKILLAGATGYLGSYIVGELRKRDYHVRVIARNLEKLNQKKIEASVILEADPLHSFRDYSKSRETCPWKAVCIRRFGLWDTSSRHRTHLFIG
jgi:nucleoside-diphosphate-sugar epimerase